MTFDHRDCGITLLKNDHVLINLLYNVVTGKKRATNIKPKVPFTFSYTKEIRELVTSAAIYQSLIGPTCLEHKCKTIISVENVSKCKLFYPSIKVNDGWIKVNDDGFNYASYVLCMPPAGGLGYHHLPVRQ